MLDEVLRSVLQGLLAGSLYSIGALSLTISYSVTKIANLAVGEYVTIGAYIAALATIVGLDPISALTLAALATAALAIGVDESIYKPLYRRGSSPLQLLIVSIGVMLLIRYLWSIYADYSDMLFLSSRYSITPLLYAMGSPITNLHILSLGVLGIVSTSLYMFRHKTMLGKAMRALASNPDLASASGIPVWRVRRITWIVSGLLAGAMGALWAFYTSIYIETGWRLLLWIFASSIIGGIRSIPLTVAGGFIIGFSENIGMWFFNRFFGIDTAYKPIIAYIAIAVALIAGRSRLVGR